MAKTMATESTPATSSPSLARAQAVARSAADNQGQEILILDVRDRTALFDYFILVTGRSGRQLRAMADDIDELMRKGYRDKRLNMEGYNESRWIVLDYGDLVVHLFDPQARQFYRLEDLWADARQVPFPAAP